MLRNSKASSLPIRSISCDRLLLKCTFLFPPLIVFLPQEPHSQRQGMKMLGFWKSSHCA